MNKEKYKFTDSEETTPTSEYFYENSKSKNGFRDPSLAKKKSTDEFQEKQLNKEEEEEEKEKVSTIGIFHFLEIKDAPLVILALISSCLVSVVPVAVTIMVNRLFDKLSDFTSGEYSSVGLFIQDLKWASFSIALLGLGQTIFGWIQVSTYVLLAERQQARLRLTLFNSLFDKNFNWFENKPEVTGDLIQVNRCIEEYRSGLAEPMSLLTRNIGMIIALLVTSFIYSWRLSLIVMASFPVIFIFSTAMSILIAKWVKVEDDLSAEAIKVIDWNLLNFKWVKTVASAEIESNKLSGVLNHCSKGFIRYRFYSSLNVGMITSLSLMMFVQSFWFGSWLVRNNYNSSGDILSCFYALLSVANSFNAISVLLVFVQKTFINLSKAMSFVDITSENVANIAQFRPHHQLIGDIQFQNISFKYQARDTSEDIIKDLSISIPASKTTFLVGKSGSGKSTLGSLLLNLYELKSGKITINDYDITKINSEWLNTQITLLQQTCTLINGSIRDNIALGLAYKYENLSEVPQWMIEDAVEFSNLKELINTLPDGIYTQVGNEDSAIKLSGGQKQRIALARAKIRDSPVLVLDESFSALDIAQRNSLLKSVRNWRGIKTTIIITHELSQIEDNDLVYVLECGKVVEYGKKIQLLSFRDSKLSSMNDYELQRANGINSPTESDVLNLYLSREETLVDNKSPSRCWLDEQIDQKYSKKYDIESKGDSAIDEPSLSLKDTVKLINKYMDAPFIVVTVIGIILGVCATVLTPVFSYCFSKLIIGIVPTSTGLASSSYILKWSLILTGVAMGNGLFTFISKSMLCWAAENFTNNLRSFTFKKLLHQDVQWFENCNPNELSSLLINDSRELRTVCSDFIVSVFSLIAVLITSVTWAIVSGWKLALVGLSFIPLFLAFTLFYGNLSQKAENKYKDKIVVLEDVLHEAVLCVKTVICLNLKDYFRMKFKDNLNCLEKVGLGRSFVLGFGFDFSALLINLLQAVMFFYGLKLVAYSEYTLVQLMEVVTLMLFSAGSITSLLNSVPNLSRGLRAAAKIRDLLALEDDPNLTKGFAKPPFHGKNQNAYELTHVSFAYPSLKRKKILDSINLTIPNNSITCFVGESGCGKSTLISLLLRYYPVTSGYMSFFGLGVNSVDPNYLISNIAVVTQDHYFTENTLRENLLYSNPFREDLTDDDIFDVLRKVNLSEFVHSLADGLDTKLGSTQSSLISGGQSQRFSIARGLLRLARIYILDECTSSLDPENADNVKELIIKLKEDATVILVTHKEELMAISDKVVFLKNGRITEEGTFNELLKLNGDFWKLIS